MWYTRNYSKFEINTGKNLNISSYEISQLRSDIFNKYNKMNSFELIENIKDNSLELDIKSSDIRYKYKNDKDKVEEREQ